MEPHIDPVIIRSTADRRRLEELESRAAEIEGLLMNKAELAVLALELADHARRSERLATRIAKLVITD